MNYLNSFLQKWIIVELKKEGISCSKEELNRVSIMEEIGQPLHEKRDCEPVGIIVVNFFM